MVARPFNVAVVTLLFLLATACGSGDDPAASPETTSASTVEATSSAPPSTRSTEPASDFPVAAFATISESPVAEETAAAFQAALAQHDVTGGGGMSATVMTADGTWSGTTGSADGVRTVQVDDQFAIASITKPVISTQVMLMVEAGELGLDDPISDHLPGDLGFDTNGATVRQVLGHRSGLPDYYDLLYDSQQTEFQRVWTPAEVLALMPAGRTPPGTEFSYTETNYLLLSLMIEHLAGRPLVEVLRDGALDVDGIDRLVYQPEERPSAPIAMPAGASSSVLDARGGYVPSLASVSAYHASGAIASDSPSLARWWRALCSGEIVSADSLTQMSTFEPAANIGGYGLGLYNPANGSASGFGHTGQLPGYMSWAACLPEEGAVIVVLTNHEVDDGHFAYSHGLARPLIEVFENR